MIKDSWRKKLQGDMFKTSSFMAISQAISSISRFLLVTILARYLSPESYGIWVSITSVAAIMMFGDFGITNALRNKLSFLLASPENTDNIQREYFYTAFYFFFLLSIVLAISFYFISSYLPIEKMYKSQNEVLKQQGVTIFIFIQITFILGLSFGIASGLFHSYNESKYAAIFNMLNPLFSLISILILTFIFHSNIVLLAKVYFSMTFLLGIFTFVFFVYKRNWQKNFNINIKKAPKRIMELLKTGIMFLGVQLSTSFINNVPTVFLAAAVDLRIAASYNIAQKLYSMVSSIYQSIFNPFWGKLAFLAGQQKWKEFKSLHFKLIKLTFIVFSLFTIILTISSKFIFKIIVGSQYDISLPVVFLLGISSMFYIAFEATSLFQNVLGKLRLRLVLELIFAIIINFIFTFSLKVFGVYSIPTILSLFWILLFISLLYQERNYLKYNSD